jgi:RNA polymerase sigma-70 factor (ECF subfamily)
MPDVLANIEASIPALRRYARLLLRDAQDSDDLVHEVPVHALDNWHRRQPDASLRPWLFRIMHNLHVSWRQRAKVRRNIPILETVEDGYLSRQAAQDTALHCKETMEAFDRLPQEHQQILLLVCVEDLTYAEVAAVLGIPTGTVMSRLSWARDRLRQLMGSEVSPPLRRVK